MTDLVDYLRDKLAHADDACTCPVLGRRGWSADCPLHGRCGYPGSCWCPGGDQCALRRR